MNQSSGPTHLDIVFDSNNHHNKLDKIKFVCGMLSLKDIMFKTIFQTLKAMELPNVSIQKFVHSPCKSWIQSVIMSIVLLIKLLLID